MELNEKMRHQPPHLIYTEVKVRKIKILYIFPSWKIFQPTCSETNVQNFIFRVSDE